MINVWHQAWAVKPNAFLNCYSRPPLCVATTRKDIFPQDRKIVEQCP